MTEPPSGFSPATAAGAVLGASTTMLLIAAGRHAQHRLDEALAPHGLSLRHIGVLAHLAHSPGLSYSDLARRAQITPQSMHATMNQLIALDAVVTHYTPGKRGSQSSLNARGRELLDLASQIATTLDETLQKTIPELPDLHTTLTALARPARP